MSDTAARRDSNEPCANHPDIIGPCMCPPADETAATLDLDSFSQIIKTHVRKLENLAKKEGAPNTTFTSGRASGLMLALSLLRDVSCKDGV